LIYFASYIVTDVYNEEWKANEIKKLTAWNSIKINPNKEKLLKSLNALYKSLTDDKYRLTEDEFNNLVEWLKWKKNESGNIQYIKVIDGRTFVYYNNEQWVKENPNSPQYFLYSTLEERNMQMEIIKKTIQETEDELFGTVKFTSDVREKIRQIEKQTTVEDSLKELENAYKNQKINIQKDVQNVINDLTLKLEAKEISKKEFHELEMMHMSKIDQLDAEYNKLKDLLKSLKEAEVIGELDYRIMYEKFPHVFKGGTGAEYLKILLDRIDLRDFIAANQAELKAAPKSKHKKILQKLKLASSLFKSDKSQRILSLKHSRFFLRIFVRWSNSMVDVLLHQISMISIVVLSIEIIVFVNSLNLVLQTWFLRMRNVCFKKQSICFSMVMSARIVQDTQQQQRKNWNLLLIFLRENKVDSVKTFSVNVLTTLVVQ
jgi:hypothetical protein